MNSHGSKKRNELIQIKVSPDEKLLVKQAAFQEGYSTFTTWARAILITKSRLIQGTHP